MKCIKCSKEILDESAYCSFCGKKQVLALPPPRKQKMRGNGQGTAYRLPNGKYRAAVTIGYTEDKRCVRKTKSNFKTKKEAVEYLQKLHEASKHQKKMKFSELYKEWSNRHFDHISKKRERAYTTAYKHCKDLHYINITDLKLKDFQDVIDKRKGEYYPKHDMRVLFNLMFKYALQNDYVEKSYTSYLKLPPLTKSNKDAFDLGEIKLLWEDYNKGNDFTGYILIMIYTGMRHGELKILKKENIFLDKDYMIGGIKTAAGIDRQIVIAQKIKPIIIKFYNENNDRLLEMPDYKFAAAYREALSRAGTRYLTPHCCRHTFATLMAESGI